MILASQLQLLPDDNISIKFLLDNSPGDVVVTHAVLGDATDVTKFLKRRPALMDSSTGLEGASS